MQKQSSYIFLKRDDIDKPENIDNLISKKFPNAKEDNTGILRINNIKRKCEIDSCSVFFNLKIIPFIANYLDITVEGEEESAIIKCLEEVQDKLLNSGIRDNYIAIISYDAISEYYCNKMVVKLNEFERNLRKLLFNIYILSFGKEYYQATLPSDLQNKIKGRIDSTSKEHIKLLKEEYAVNKEQATEVARLQLFFYSLEFGDILNFLFEPRSTEYDKKATENFLSKHSDLPKSDWDRFFSDKIKKDNIKELINEIRKYRNSVAHFKLFYNKDYTECNKKVTELNNAIIKAIRMTEEIDFSKKNAQMLDYIFSDFRKDNDIVKLHYKNKEDEAAADDNT